MRNGDVGNGGRCKDSGSGSWYDVVYGNGGLTLQNDDGG